MVERTGRISSPANWSGAACDWGRLEAGIQVGGLFRPDSTLPPPPPPLTVVLAVMVVVRYT